jgi:predicted  nucleic acid-binding Zn-ribbon protein
MPENKQNGWNEYSKLVLKELESLNDNIDGLNSEIQHVKQEIAKMQVREDKVDEIKVWKEKIDDVVSPTQLSAALKEIEDLRAFKTKAVTIFMVVQFMMGTAMYILKILFE